jgi:hypothetical protein
MYLLYSERGVKNVGYPLNAYQYGQNTYFYLLIRVQQVNYVFLPPLDYTVCMMHEQSIAKVCTSERPRTSPALSSARIFYLFYCLLVCLLLSSHIGLPDCPHHLSARSTACWEGSSFFAFSFFIFLGVLRFSCFFGVFRTLPVSIAGCRRPWPAAIPLYHAQEPATNPRPAATATAAAAQTPRHTATSAAPPPTSSASSPSGPPPRPRS